MVFLLHNLQIRNQQKHLYKLMYFDGIEMPYDSYNGVNVRLRYILKVTISRNYVGDTVEYEDFPI
jgi:hypothetical protein